MTYDQIFSQTINDSKEKTVFDIQDFKKSQTGSAKINSREFTYKMSMSGSRDGIAESGLKNIINQNPWATSDGQSVNDMIKFGFECINNDDPSNSLFLQFRAYLTNGITDSNQASLNSFKYMGRGEDFFVYQGFTRTMAFSFRIAVENSQDLESLYNKLNALVSQVYPDYSKGGVMRTSLTRITIGDYIYRMPGLLESINVTVNQDSPWEIENGNQMPHYVDVAVTFRPIHEEVPVRVKNDNDRRLLLYNNYYSPVLNINASQPQIPNNIINTGQQQIPNNLA